MTKIVTWNVNGLRACLDKGFMDYFKSSEADIFCLQETKLQAGQVDMVLEGYEQFWNYAETKGYSGTAVFSRLKPLSESRGIEISEHDSEGRVITLEYDDFFLVNVYTPNAGRELARLEYRMSWEDSFRDYLTGLDVKKPVIVCGDLNVAHRDIDLKNPKTNHGSAGFTDQERGKFTELLGAGFTDAFRYLYPEAVGQYTWWTYMFKARERNVGWRIDYFCISERIREKIQDCVIRSEIMGSDHCPVELTIF